MSSKKIFIFRTVLVCLYTAIAFLSMHRSVITLTYSQQFSFIIFIIFVQPGSMQHFFPNIIHLTREIVTII